jgi:hypothetical protein
MLQKGKTNKCGYTEIVVRVNGWGQGSTGSVKCVPKVFFYRHFNTIQPILSLNDRLSLTQYSVVAVTTTHDPHQSYIYPFTANSSPERPCSAP